jgi:hypothetical protein
MSGHDADANDQDACQDMSQNYPAYIERALRSLDTTKCESAYANRLRLDGMNGLPSICLKGFGRVALPLCGLERGECAHAFIFMYIRTYTYVRRYAYIHQDADRGEVEPYVHTCIHVYMYTMFLIGKVRNRNRRNTYTYIHMLGMHTRAVPVQWS